MHTHATSDHLVSASLRAARRAQGLTQAALGQALGVSQATISLIERGERAPAREVEELCREFITSAFPGLARRDQDGSRPRADAVFAADGGMEVLVEVKHDDRQAEAETLVEAADQLLWELLARFPRKQLFQVMMRWLPECAEELIEAPDVDEDPAGTGAAARVKAQRAEQVRKLAERARWLRGSLTDANSPE